MGANGIEYEAPVKDGLDSPTLTSRRFANIAIEPLEQPYMFARTPAETTRPKVFA